MIKRDLRPYSILTSNKSILASLLSLKWFSGEKCGDWPLAVRQKTPTVCRWAKCALCGPLPT